MKQSTKDCEVLYDKVIRCLKDFNGMFDSKEDEVQFRYEAIRGMLLMAANDIGDMLKHWKQDDSEVGR